MKKYLNGILFVVGAIVLVVVGIVISKTDYAGYSVLCYTLAAVAVVLGVSSLFTSSSPTKLYDSKVRNLLNTYDSILVKSNTIPSLEGRNIVHVEKMEDLVDAQLELRKPICYLKQTESCSFVLLDEKEAYVYVEKLNDDVVSPVEIELNNLRIKEKDKDDMDSEMLKGIEKTTIVKLSNRKSYKVSPVRKKKDEAVEEKKEEVTEEVKPEEEAPKFEIKPEEITQAQEEMNTPEEPVKEEKVVEEKPKKVKEDLEVI